MKTRIVSGATPKDRIPSGVSLIQIVIAGSGTIKVLVLIVLSLTPPFVEAQVKSDGSDNGTRTAVAGLLPKPEKGKFQIKGGKLVNLVDLTKTEYIEVCKAMIKESEENREVFWKQSKQLLIGILNLEGKPERQGFMDISPIFNRSMLFAMLAVHNKIKLDAEEMDNFKAECVANSGKAKEYDRMIIMTIYASVFSENEKLAR
ncbi:MAG: hypothetical protein NTW21_37085 [Verrucomicrobia bacterium]|nr:hypothetical protein [Verrucomicrobiota bacterium]